MNLEDRYCAVRQLSQQLCKPLVTEDMVVQSMPDVSPTKWHLAHTSWFFETFVLKQLSSYQVFNSSYDYLFNSYYNSVGSQYPRSLRGLISRPTVKRIMMYRHHVDTAMISWLQTVDTTSKLLPITLLGLHHEQQHQELMLTDIKHVLSCNPSRPAYHVTDKPNANAKSANGWIEYPGGLHEIGCNNKDFSFDNEQPRHKVYVPPYQLASRLVTNYEYLEFMKNGGYQQPILWLSLGWKTVQQHNWQSPLYWIKQNKDWFEFTLAGSQPLSLNAPVCHISYFEADAFARWTNARLPTEAEWEIAANSAPVAGNFVENNKLHPLPLMAKNSASPVQLFGDVWEWTASPYTAYPGYNPPAGAIGEYNGKFMCNQYVLRGGSCVTPQDHVRSSYRNFWPAETKFQFSGIRIAKTL